MILLIVVLSLSFLVFIHEFGHFVAAKISGIKVEEFALGFGPRIVSKRRGETIYAIRALPFGGFVKMTGMGLEEDIPEEDKPRSYAAQSVPKRIMTVAAGPIMNIFLAIAIFWIVFMLTGVPEKPNNVVEVVKDGPAMLAGVKAGDLIVEVDGQKIDRAETAVEKIKAKPGQRIKIVIDRGGRRIELHPLLQKKDGAGFLGVAFSPIFVKGRPISAVYYSFKTTWLVVIEVLKTFKRMPELVKMMSEGKQPGIAGPVGIYKVTAKVAYQGLVAFLGFIAVLSISLGIFNIMPLPPLDGGHILYATVEGVTGRPINPNIVAMLQMIGFLLLLIFFIMVTYSDVVHPIPGI